jgi:hypothetical protein
MAVDADDEREAHRRFRRRQNSHLVLRLPRVKVPATTQDQT